MKIAVSLTDQSFYATASVGIYNVSIGLCKGLINCPEISELHLLINEEMKDLFANCPPHVHLHFADKPAPSRFKRLWWDQIGVCAAMRRIKPDWVILPKGVPPLLPMFGKAKVACYLHDLNWEYYENRPDSPIPPAQFIYFKQLRLHSLRVSDLVLTSTQFNLERFHHYVPKSNVKVVGIGFDDETRTPELQTGRDVLFYVSTYPHKLTPLGIERLQAWLQQRPDADKIRIHMLGKMPDNMPQLPEQWIHHGRLPQDEMNRIMHHECRMAVYFSEYEGFGMPPVECLRAGMPCISSDLPPIRENIPSEYLFSNESEQSFIQTANAVYDGSLPFNCPQYPDWNEVAKRCVSAMQTP